MRAEPAASPAGEQSDGCVSGRAASKEALEASPRRKPSSGAPAPYPPAQSWTGPRLESCPRRQTAASQTLPCPAQATQKPEARWRRGTEDLLTAVSHEASRR
mgnify:CR=1 FL=1